MSAPPPMQPPMDPDHRALIDQLAHHAAVNGPSAQEALRHTHYGDPRYAFLYDGGEFNDYYRWRLMGQVNATGGPPMGGARPPPPPPPPLMGGSQFFPSPAPSGRPSFGPPHQQMRAMGPPGRLPPPGLVTLPPGLVHAPRLASIGLPQLHHPPQPRLPQPPPPSPKPLKASAPTSNPQIAEKIAELQKQIADSETNLRAHQEQLQLQKTQRVETEWREREEKRLQELFTQAALSLQSFEALVDRLAQSGSKESVSNAKKWIFDNCTMDRQREVCLTYLLHRTRCKGATEQLKLHILYLMNDWAHHCHRKNLDSIRQMLSRYVPKLYAYASSAISATGDRHLQEKLDKLIGVWDSSRYFDDNCQKQMRNTSATLTAEQTIIQAEQQRITVELQLEMEATLKGYEKQHQEYEKHIQTKIAQLEAEQLQREREEAELEARKSAPRSSLTPHHAHPSSYVEEKSFTAAPKCPHWDLPAGMMVPLVAIDDCTYKPIEVAKLRAPLSTPPNEHLLKQLDRFYQFQSMPDNPRDADCWEAKGLLDFYVKKAEARVKLELDLKKEGMSFEDAITNKYIPGNPSSEETHQGRKRRRSSSASSSFSSSSSGSDERRGGRRRSCSPERPSFSGGGGFKTPSAPAPLDRETNKGAQLMAKMGWEGRGLGAKEQGIEEPIHGGHIRSRSDKYVGVGVTPINALLNEPQEDPFAEYRRQMSLKKLSTFKK